MQEIVRKGLELVSGLDEPLQDGIRMIVHAKAQCCKATSAPPHAMCPRGRKSRTCAWIPTSGAPTKAASS
jgi:hypothetical protein